MSKKVLIISASARRGGNSDVLCDQFAQGAKEAGHDVEKVFLADKTVNYCKGCYACSHTKGVCVHKDDMTELLEQMIRADVLVLATPVYFYNMNAQLKTVIDRTVAREKEIRELVSTKEKEAYLIAAAAEGEMSVFDGTRMAFHGFIDYYHIREAGLILAMNVFGKGDINKSPVMAEAYQAGLSV